MSRNTGIWIDSKQAVVIELGQDSNKITRIVSNIETRSRDEGEKAHRDRFGTQTISDEKTKLHKMQGQVREFIQQVITKCRRSDHLVVFGPARMKFEFEKAFKRASPPLPNLLGVEIADSMTENQMVAWVQGYFSSAI